MNIHAGSLGQFLLSSRMQREIERQKSLPPRWQRPMIFRTAEQAAHFVGRIMDKEGGDTDSWHRAKVVLACTHGYYSWPQQAEAVMRTIAEMDEPTGTVEKEHGGMRIEMTRTPDELEIVFHVAEEEHQYRFRDHEDSCVPVEWEVGPEETPS